MATQGREEFIPITIPWLQSTLAGQSQLQELEALDHVLVQEQRDRNADLFTCLLVFSWVSPLLIQLKGPCIGVVLPNNGLDLPM